MSRGLRLVGEKVMVNHDSSKHDAAGNQNGLELHRKILSGGAGVKRMNGTNELEFMQLLLEPEPPRSRAGLCRQRRLERRKPAENRKWNRRRTPARLGVSR